MHRETIRYIPEVLYNYRLLTNKLLPHMNSYVSLIEMVPLITTVMVFLRVLSYSGPCEVELNTIPNE